MRDQHREHRGAGAGDVRQQQTARHRQCGEELRCRRRAEPAGSSVTASRQWATSSGADEARERLF